MAKTVTEQQFKNAKEILKTSGGDVKRAVFVTRLSERTVRRIKRSKSFKDYKILLAGDHEDWKIPEPPGHKSKWWQFWKR